MNFSCDSEKASEYSKCCVSSFIWLFNSPFNIFLFYNIYKFIYFFFNLISNKFRCTLVPSNCILTSLQFQLEKWKKKNIQCKIICTTFVWVCSLLKFILGVSVHIHVSTSLITWGQWRSNFVGLISKLLVNLMYRYPGKHKVTRYFLCVSFMLAFSKLQSRVRYIILWKGGRYRLCVGARFEEKTGFYFQILISAVIQLQFSSKVFAV